MGKRVLRALLLAALLVLILPPYAGMDRGSTAVRLIVISPPSRLALPIGQAAEVRCRIVGPAAVVELWSDDTLVATESLQPGQDFTHAWAPASAGTHCLRVRVLDAGNALMAQERRCVVGLARGARVRVAALQ